MILPASYANGFAPRDGQPLYPELWRGCVGAWSPCLGPSGLTLRDWSGFGNHGVLTNGPTWGVSGGQQALQFDGVDDYISVDGLVSRCAQHTRGALCCWVNLKTDNVSQNSVFSFSRDALGTQSYFLLDFDMRFGSKLLNVSVAVDGVILWRYNTTAGSIFPGQWIHVAVVQNGVAPVIYLNGQRQTLTPITVTDTTAWFKAILTDASSKADTANIGILEFNGADIVPVPAAIDAFRIYDIADATWARASIDERRRGIAHELAPIRHAGETAASYRRRLQAAQLIGGGMIG